MDGSRGRGQEEVETILFIGSTGDFINVQGITRRV